MNRTVVYPRTTAVPSSQGARTRVPAGRTRGLEAEEPPTPSASPPTPVDGYVDKLIKYVPAEVVAIFAPLSAALASRHGLLMILAVICLVATPGYLFLTAQDKSADLQPLPHYYVLATIAFAAWALGVSTELGSIVKLDAVEVGLILGGSVLLIPLIDGLLARLKI